MSQVLLSVTERSQTAEARRITVGLAQEVRCTEHECGLAAIIATELATNLVKHAVGGSMYIRLIEQDRGYGLEVVASDRGPGIGNVSRAVEDGYSTAGSMGTGLGAVMRAATEFDIYSQPDKGTTVVARLWRAGKRPSRLRIGVIHQPKGGEDVNGDGWLVMPLADEWLCAVADGLGHGLFAKQAADAALGAVRGWPEHRTAVDCIKQAHAAARHTLGTALAVAVRDPEGQIRFAGVGNIVGAIIHHGQRRHLVSRDGILGRSCLAVKEDAQPWSADATLVLHSDGVSGQWDLTSYPGLVERDPSLIATVLLRDFSRGGDDVTVVVVKEAT